MAEPLEDEFNTETLQAQLDMSFSFAQDLASTWMKSSKNSPSSNGVGLSSYEKELQDIIRRPPRLGVGAPLPEAASGSSLTREAALLKHKLDGKGKKHARTEEDTEEKTEGGDDDEEESRASAIRKKIKVDPFATSEGKKKKKSKDPLAAHLSTSFARTSAQMNKTQEGEEADEGGSPPHPTTIVDADCEKDKEPIMEHRKRKRKRKNKDAYASIDAHEAINGELMSLTGPLDAQISPTASAPIPTSSSRPITSSHPPSSPTKSVEKNGMFDVPLLNLSGPPPADNLEGCVLDSSIKKKRHRKKKKRHGVSESGGGDA